MKSLLFRTLALVLGTLAAFIVVLASILAFGSTAVFRAWEEREEDALRSYVEAKVAEAGEAARRESRTLTEADIRVALDKLPYPPALLFVLSADNVPLFHFRRSEGPGSGGGQNLERRIGEIDEWYDVRGSDGTLYARYHARPVAFDERESNSLLLGAASLILLWAAAAALAAAVGFAFVFALPMASHAAALSRSLELIGSGRRDVVPPEGAVAELNSIARSAAELQERLGREEALRRQWAADVAHDLRTPLAALRASLEAMADGVLEATPARIEGSLRQLRTLERLTADLSLLTVLESPSFAPKREELDGAAAAESAAERFRDRPDGRELRLELQELRLSADPALLDRALSNLLDNALRYGRPDRPVMLRTDRDGAGRPRFSVENGGTIGEEVLPRIFDRLYRGDGGRGTPGSGLGLSIARAVAEAHGAELAASCDREGDSTRFTLTFT